MPIADVCPQDAPKRRSWWSRLWYSDVGEFLWESMKDPTKWVASCTYGRSVKNEELGIELRTYASSYKKSVSVIEGSQAAHAGLTTWDNHRLHDRVLRLASGDDLGVLKLKRKLGII